MKKRCNRIADVFPIQFVLKGTIFGTNLFVLKHLVVPKTNEKKVKKQEVYIHKNAVRSNKNVSELGHVEDKR